MTRTFCSVVAFLALVSSAFAQVHGNVESQIRFKQGAVTPNLCLYLKGPLHGQFGWTFWSLASECWSEGYLGLTYAPAKWIEVSASAGLETNEGDAFRWASSLWMGKGPNSLFVCYENGGSGPWYKAVARHNLSPRFAAGVHSQACVGTGPYGEVRFGKKKDLIIWGSYLFPQGGGPPNQLVGIKMKF